MHASIQKSRLFVLYERKKQMRNIQYNFTKHFCVMTKKSDDILTRESITKIIPLLTEKTIFTPNIR